MTDDEDAPPDTIWKRLVAAAKAVAAKATPSGNPGYFVPNRQIWDLQDAVSDLAIEVEGEK